MKRLVELMPEDELLWHQMEELEAQIESTPEGPEREALKKRLEKIESPPADGDTEFIYCDKYLPLEISIFF